MPNDEIGRHCHRATGLSKQETVSLVIVEKLSENVLRFGSMWDFPLPVWSQSVNLIGQLGLTTKTSGYIAKILFLFVLGAGI